MCSAFLKFVEVAGRRPKADTSTEDNAKLTELLQTVLETGNVPKEKVPAEFVEYVNLVLFP